jgi:hypothetical protein
LRSDRSRDPLELFEQLALLVGCNSDPVVHDRARHPRFVLGKDNFYRLTVAVLDGRSR